MNTSKYKPILNNLLLLLIRIISIMIIYQVCRLFYLLYNIDYFSTLNIYSYLKIVFGSIKFDLSAILYTNSLLIFLSLFPLNIFYNNYFIKFKKYIFILFNFCAIILNVIDTLYYPFSKNRFTISFINEFSNENNITSFIMRFGLDYWYVIPIIIATIYILRYISNITLSQQDVIYNFKNLPISIVITITIFILTIFGCRGSFIYKNRPITISNAGKYANNPNEISLIINTPFSLLRTAHIKDLKKRKFFTEEDLNKIYNIKHHYNDTVLNKKNIIIIILESMGMEYYGAYNNTNSYTPFLDSLINHSYSSYNSFSNGKKSIDAMPAILASIPNTNFHFSLSKYTTNAIQGIGSLLESEGYTTSFFHGAPNGSMGFESMANLCGIKNYYGMNEYNNNKDFDGLWGIWDDKFFNYFGNKLNLMKEPFFSGFFSCSSHHPYKIPEGYKKSFKEGKHPMHKCVQYTDYSLQQFFKQIKDEKWYNNTLFVITADHTNISFDKKYKTSIGIFRVPIIFFDPSDNKKRLYKSEKIIQHIDILPSILSYIGYNKPFISFGNNLFDLEENNFSINYHNDYQLIIDDKLIIYNESNDKITKVYNFKNDQLLKNNIIKDIDPDILEKYKKKIYAFIQNYNNRMINNNLKL